MITYKISDEQEAKINKWQETHKCKYRGRGGIRYVGACGGADQYIFIPTGLGTILTVRCACGSEISMDDF